MRAWIAILALLVPLFVSAANNANPMSAGDVTCPQHLALAKESPEKAMLHSWVAGRVAAIVPATFQPELRKVDLRQFHMDIQEVCTRSDPEFMIFDVSAILAHGYQQDQRN